MVLLTHEEGIYLETKKPDRLVRIIGMCGRLFDLKNKKISCKRNFIEVAYKAER